MAKKPVTLAIASGKGGTGKSCVAASLMVTVPEIIGADADVEEPNLSILLGAIPYASSLVETPLPVIDEALCDRCGKCVEACRFSALNMFGNNFPSPNNLCHGCGVCSMVCPRNAITETGKPVGEIRMLRGNGMSVFEGRLFVGMPNPIPLIQATIDAAMEEKKNLVIDCPPGTSCPMVAAVRNADMVILVTEPTPFGAADLNLALQVIINLDKPAAVVINRSDLGGADIDSLASRYGVPIAARLPFSRSIAESYARGNPPASMDLQWKEAMLSIWESAERISGN